MWFNAKGFTHTSFPHYLNFLPPGLGNPGNLCYFNSLLQTFASSTQWIHFFRKTAHVHPLLNEMNMLMSSLSDPFAANTSLSTKSCRQQLSKAGLVISPEIQQDFHEFYMRILKIMQSLFKQSSTAPFCSFATTRIFPTHCIYEETIKCPLCNHANVSINQDSSFIIQITNGNLHTALQEYFGPFRFKSQCAKCHRTSDRILTRRIIFAPRSILFFINRRTIANSNIPSCAPFSFPLYIDIEQFSFINEPIESPPDSGLLKISLNGISEAIQENRKGYKLTSVVAFKGSDNSGHYYTYRLHREVNPPYAQQWICANDSRTSAVTFEKVISSRGSVLLLHYEKPMEI